MSRGFVFLHGLPGSGKTSLCRALAGMREDVYYANMATSPTWGQEPSWQICADDFLDHLGSRWLISEGFAARRAPRDRFVTRVTESLEQQAGVLFDTVQVMFLRDPGSEHLAQRRNRTADAYELLRSRIETGSRVHAYSVLDCAPDEPLPALASRMSRHLDEWLG